MRNLSDYRAEARAALRGKWNTSALFVFVYALIVGAVNAVASPMKASLLGTLLILPMAYGYTVAFLRQNRGEEQQIGWLFNDYNRRVWITLLLRYIYTILWCLLLIIPGIIKSYSYMMTEYILHDNPELDGNIAIEKSMAMMDGHKMRLFLLDLSFIGWAILCVFTLGIGMFWLAPYISSSHAAFYEELKRDYEANLNNDWNAAHANI